MMGAARVLLGIFLAVLLAGIEVGMAAEPYSEKSERNFEVAGRPSLKVRNPDGSTFLQGGDSANVYVEAIKEVREAKDEGAAREAAQQVDIRFHQSGNRIEIESIYPKHFFSFGRKPHVRVTFRIRAPRGSDIDASGADGNLEVRNFEGDLRLAVADGDMLAEDVSGKISMKGADGDLHATRCSGTIEFSVADGDLQVERCSGNIRASSADGTLTLNEVDGAVEARTADGDLHLNGTLRSLSAKAADGTMDVRVRNGSTMEGDWSLRSADGNILLHLPESFSAEVEASSSDGHIETQKPILIQGSVSSNRIRGKLGNGGHLLQIHTSDGTIQILGD